MGREPLASDFLPEGYEYTDKGYIVAGNRKGTETIPEVLAKPKSESLRPPVEDNQSLRQNFGPKNRRNDDK